MAEQHPLKPDAPVRRGPDRRTVLAGLSAALLSGCGSVFFRDMPETDAPAPPVVATARMRVVLFELRGINMPYHAGVIIDAPEESVIYDPSGQWHGAGITRDGDLIRGVTPEIAAAYLRRDDFAYYGMGWTAHVFDRAVTPEVARLAIDRAEAAPRMPPLHCAYGTSGLLEQLPGFEYIHQTLVPGVLFAALRARPEFTYSRDVLE